MLFVRQERRASDPAVKRGGVMSSKPIRWAVWMFAMAALAVALALAGRYGAGYTVFVVPPWRIEMSMIMFFLLIIVLAGLSYFVVRLSIRAAELPQQLRQQKREREKARLLADLHNSLGALFSGRFDDAEKLAKRAMSAKQDAEDGGEDLRHLATALAAWAAHEAGNLPAALPYLETIQSSRSANMRDASKAYMLLAEGRAAEALPVLQALAEKDPTNIGVLKMKVEAEIAARAWTDVLQTLGPLKRTGLMPASAADAIRLNAEVELIKSRPAQRDSLLDAWRKLDTAIRYQPVLVDTLAARLIALGLGNDAAAVLEETIDRLTGEQWSPQLLVRYAQAKSDSTLAQIERAEGWLRQQPRDAALLAALGKLCIRQALWGKAQSYLEASVALAPSLDAHMTLARLMEQTGKPQEAMRHIRRSAELANQDQRGRAESVAE
jgi:HemY protein